MAAETPLPERFWRFIVGLILCAVPAVVAASIWIAWQVPTPEVYVLATEPSRIYYVIPGSGAEAAGLRAGDVILSLNGRPFVADELARVIKNLHVGQAAAITLRRPGGEEIDLTLPLVPAAQVTRAALIRATFIALAFWSASALLLWRRFLRWEVRLLFLLAQAIALTMVFIPSMPVIIWYHSFLACINISGISGFLAPGLLFHYHVTFPVRLGARRQRRWVLGLVYGLSLLLAASWIMVNYGWLPYLTSVLASAVGAIMILWAP